MMLEVENFFLNVVNMVSCGGIQIPCGIDVTSVVLINFILFYFIFLKLKYVFKMYMLINDKSRI